MAITSKYTTIYRVIENMYRDYGFTDAIKIESVIEHVADAIDLIGVPMVYKNKITNDIDEPVIEIVDYKAKLPCDFIEEVMIRDWDSKIVLLPISNKFNNTNSEYDYATDYREKKYKIESPYIKTNYTPCSLEIVYKAFNTGDDGYPLIPDDTRYLKAVTAYIAERIAFKLYLQGMLDEKRYEKINQEWLFYVRSASTRAHTKNLSEMEAFKNQIQRLIQSPNQFGKGFQDLGDQEKIYI